MAGAEPILGEPLARTGPWPRPERRTFAGRLVRLEPVSAERHAAELYKAGATDAVPETLESSLQLSEALLVDLGMAMGPVIASIHEKRAELRKEIMELGEIDKEPPLQRRRLRDAAR